MRACRAEIDRSIDEALDGWLIESRDATAARIEMLLSGERPDRGDLKYELDASHVGLVAARDGETVAAVSELANYHDGNHLLLERPTSIWAWFGSTDSGDLGIDGPLSSSPAAGVTVAVGEPGQGLQGWRLTHRQASSAFSIARKERRVVRYADVALLASMTQDEALTTSLRRRFLAPLEREPDGGEALRGTLRAYLSSGRNASAAGAELGVSRNTVTNRLRAIESRTGHSPHRRAPEFEAALEIDRLSRR